jgi:hypothetical protein
MNTAAPITNAPPIPAMVTPGIIKNSTRNKITPSKIRRIIPSIDIPDLVLVV